MNTERTTELERRAALHAALADPARLQIVDTLTVGDASPSELSTMLGMPSNLLAHHLNALESVGLIVRTRSEGDRRRSYLRFVPDGLEGLSDGRPRGARRVLFVCTANSARSHLAAALWRRASEVPGASAGTHPASGIDPGAVAAAQRHHLPMRRLRPRRLDEVQADGDLIITVCDLAHEELGELAKLHWSVPDPVRAGNITAFDNTVADLTRRVDELAPRITAAAIASLTALQSRASDQEVRR